MGFARSLFPHLFFPFCGSLWQRRWTVCRPSRDKQPASKCMPYSHLASVCRPWSSKGSDKCLSHSRRCRTWVQVLKLHWSMLPSNSRYAVLLRSSLTIPVFVIFFVLAKIWLPTEKWLVPNVKIEADLLRGVFGKVHCVLRLQPTSLSLSQVVVSLLSLINWWKQQKHWRRRWEIQLRKGSNKPFLPTKFSLLSANVNSL